MLHNLTFNTFECFKGVSIDSNFPILDLKSYETYSNYILMYFI